MADRCKYLCGKPERVRVITALDLRPATIDDRRNLRRGSDTERIKQLHVELKIDLRTDLVVPTDSNESHPYGSPNGPKE